MTKTFKEYKAQQERRNAYMREFRQRDSFKAWNRLYMKRYREKLTEKKKSGAN